MLGSITLDYDRLLSHILPMLKHALILLLIMLSSTSFGFGYKAHQIITQIAQNHLSAKANSAITDILKGEPLTSASTWADEMRYSNDNSEFWSYDYSSNWHFVNIETNKTYVQSRKNRRGDAYTALLAFIDILENKEAPTGAISNGIALYLKGVRTKDKDLATKQLALKFLIHIVSDLHQPLHVGYEKDRGGNTINVRWMNRETNLHSVWDTRLVEYQDLSANTFGEKLMIKVSKIQPSRLSQIQHSTPMDWINEGLLIRDNIYPNKKSLGKDYAEKFTPLMELQLMNAGLRLAATLNRVFK